VTISLFSLLPLWLLCTNLPLVDQSDEWEAFTWGDRVLDLPLAREAAILADSVRIAPLYYLQRIEGRRPDLDLLVLADEAAYRSELTARLAAGQRVYLARLLPGLEGRYHLRSLGPLTQVDTAPTMQPPALDGVLDARFGLDVEDGNIELLGITGPMPGPEGGTGLTLYWRAEEPIGEAYHVRMRLVDDEGKVRWQEKGSHPANNYYPFPAWRPGEVVADYHEIPLIAIDATASSTRLTVQTGLFRPFSDDSLATRNGEPWIPVAELALDAQANRTPPQHRLSAVYSGAADGAERWSEESGGLALAGVDVPDIVAAGSAVELRLYRSGSDLGAAPDNPDPLAFPGRPSATWKGREGNSIEALVLESWAPSRLLLQTPDRVGDFELSLGFVGQDGRFLTARCGWLARPTDSCVVADVRLSDVTSSALANFDGKMMLLDAVFDMPGLSERSPLRRVAGQDLPLILHWQGLESIDKDYTVSVQLVGPDGRLHGQTDSWPVQGTLPTSQWSAGQRIVDPYEVVLDGDAPPGEYRVGVVVYLLETQSRLPVVDELGQATDDIVWVGEVEVLPE
jgi:hypothetical protein